MKRASRRRILIAACLIIPFLHLCRGGAEGFGFFMIICEIVLAFFIGYTAYPKRRDGDNDD